MKNSDKLPAISRLIEIMQQLRSPEGGCPWDLEQTHQTLVPYIIEEVYEVVEAIEKNDMEALKGELGDLLLHIAFHAQLASEKGEFNMEDVADTLNKKIIQRHPHVFGDAKVESSGQVKVNWEAIKMKNEHRSLLSGVPKHLPALLKAYRVQEKSADVGFEWKDISGVDEKLGEEMAEFNMARASGEVEKIEEELGDMLFVLVNLGRRLGVNAESALNKTVEKFMKRFEYIEKRLSENGSSPQQSNLEEMDGFYEEYKDKKEKH